jgi:cell division protein FtsB
MAEVEVGGMTFKGGKMFLLVTVLSTLGGMAWGAFEFYNDYRNMKEMIESYVAPDMSEINQGLAVQSERMESLEASMRILVADIDKLDSESFRNINNVEDLARQVDDRTAETQRELRDDVYALEEKVNDRLRVIDEDLREARKDLEDKIQTILENPLNDVE